MPAIRAARGWITTISKVIEQAPCSFLQRTEVNFGQNSHRRLSLRADTLSHHRRTRGAALLSLPDVPTGPWSPVYRLANRAARRVRGDGRRTCLPLVG